MFEDKQKYWTITNPLNIEEPIGVMINKEQIACVEVKSDRLVIKMSNGSTYEIECTMDNVKNLQYYG